MWKRSTILLAVILLGLVVAKNDKFDDYDDIDIDDEDDNDLFLDVDEWTGEPVQKKVPNQTLIIIEGAKGS